MRKFLIVALFGLLLAISTASAQYENENEEYDLDDYNEFDVAQAYGQFGQQYGGQQLFGSGQQYLSMLQSGGESSKKQPLQAVQLPQLTVSASKTAPLIQLPSEVHTQKTVQPIVQTRTIMQPVIRQRLVHQPILRTTTIMQPHHKWIETQPIVQPKIIQNTRVVRQFQEQPIVVPRLQEHTKVQQTFQNKARTLQTITNQPQFESTPVQESKTHLPALQAINSNPQLMQNLGLNPDPNLLMMNLQGSQ